MIRVVARHGACFREHSRSSLEVGDVVVVGTWALLNETPQSAGWMWRDCECECATVLELKIAVMLASSGARAPVGGYNVIRGHEQSSTPRHRIITPQLFVLDDSASHAQLMAMWISEINILIEDRARHLN